MAQRRLAKATIRFNEIVLNLLMRGCLEGLEKLSKARAELSIPDFHVAIRNRDIRAIGLLAKSLARAGHSPYRVYRIAQDGVPDLTPQQWGTLLYEAHNTYPETIWR